MSDWDNLDDEEDENTISLDDLEEMENGRERENDTVYDQDDWGDSYDDLDSEAWEKQYRQEEEDLTVDPWDLG